MSGVKTRINTRFSGKRKGQNGMQKSVCSVRLGIKTPPEGLLSGGVLLGFIFSVHLGCHGLPYVLPQADAVAVPRGLSSAPPHRAAGRRVRVVNFARYFWMACFWASVVMGHAHLRPYYPISSAPGMQAYASDKTTQFTRRIFGSLYACIYRLKEVTYRRRKGTRKLEVIDLTRFIDKAGPHGDGQHG